MPWWKGFHSKLCLLPLTKSWGYRQEWLCRATWSLHSQRAHPLKTIHWRMESLKNLFVHSPDNNFTANPQNSSQDPVLKKINNPIKNGKGLGYIFIIRKYANVQKFYENITRGREMANQVNELADNLIDHWNLHGRRKELTSNGMWEWVRINYSWSPGFCKLNSDPEHKICSKMLDFIISVKIRSGK